MKALTPVLRDALARTATGTWSPPAPCSGISRRRPRAAEAALRTLRVDSVDILQLYWLGRCPRSRRGSGRDVPAPGRGEGPRAGGIDPRPARAGALAEESILDLLMIRYNAAHPGAEAEIFPRLSRRRPAVVAYTATAWRKLLRAPRGLERKGPTAGDCYRFCLASPHVDVVLTGPRTVAELRRIWRPSIGGRSPRRTEEMRAFGARSTGSAGEEGGTQDAIRNDQKGFLRMMGAAAGAAVVRRLPGIPRTLRARRTRLRAGSKAAAGEDRVPVGTVGFGAMTTRDPEVIPVRRRQGRGLRRYRGLLHGGRERAHRREALAGVRDKVVLATKVHVARWTR